MKVISGSVIFSLETAACQTFGVTIGKHRDTNKTPLLNSKGITSRKAVEARRCMVVGPRGLLRWMSGMGCRLLRRD